MELIAQGAEAKLYRDISEGTIVKDRIAKSYRIKELDDSLRKARTKREASILQKIKLISDFAPQLIKQEDTKLTIGYVDGRILKQVLDEKPELAFQTGRIVAELHKKNIIHGDLTTSNMILNKEGNIVLIDFGLSFVSARAEDKAVDIHLFRQALDSKHVAVAEKAFQNFLKGYKEAYSEDHSDPETVLERFKIVEARGRNKLKY
jgi:Kae1-associated kinase Bud32